VQGSEWLVPQVALLHTWAGEDQCRINPLQRYYLSHTHRALIIIIIYLFIYLFSRLFNVSTSFCTHLTIILSFSSFCLCHSSLLLLIPFTPNNTLIPSAQVALSLPCFLLPGGLHFIAFFGSLPSSIL